MPKSVTAGLRCFKEASFGSAAMTSMVMSPASMLPRRSRDRRFCSFDKWLVPKSLKLFCTSVSR